MEINLKSSILKLPGLLLLLFVASMFFPSAKVEAAEYFYEKYTTNTNYSYSVSWVYTGLNDEAPGYVYPNYDISNGTPSVSGTSYRLGSNGSMGYQMSYTTLYRHEYISHKEYAIYRGNIISTPSHLRGSYISTVKGASSSYPTNGRHSDGFWYVRKGTINGNLSFNNVSQNSVRISGYYNSELNTSRTTYQLYRRDITANTQEVLAGTTSGSAFTDTGLTPGHRYSYRVSATSDGTVININTLNYITLLPPTPSPTYVVGEGDWHNAEGRGKVAVSWEPTLSATGYKVWVHDGYRFRAFDVGNVTSWDSSEWRIYPSEAELDSYSNNTVIANIFNKVKGGLDLRDNPNKLYIKTEGTSLDATSNYLIYVTAYNETGETPQSASMNVQLPNRTDTDPPIVNSLVLNNGLARTGSTEVDLNINARDVIVTNHTPQTDDDYSGVDKIQVSNDNFTTFQEFEWPIDPLNGEININWTIPAGDGSKTVYVRAIDKAGNISLSQSANIYLVDDVIAPSVNVSINSGAEYITSPNAELTINATDNLSTISQLLMRLSFDGMTWQPWEEFSFVKNVTFPDTSSGTKRVFVQVRDAAGNTTIASDDVKLMTEEEVMADKLITRAEKDVTPPTIESFSLERGATATSSNSPTIWLTAFDDLTEFENLQVQFRTMHSFNWSSPVSANYVMNPSVTLEPGMNKVIIRVIDESGNKSERTITVFKL